MTDILYLGVNFIRLSCCFLKVNSRFLRQGIQEQCNVCFAVSVTLEEWESDQQEEDRKHEPESGRDIAFLRLEHKE